MSNKKDLHAETVARILDTSTDNVSKEQRRAGGVINFGLLYGGSESVIAVDSGGDVNEDKTVLFCVSCQRPVSVPHFCSSEIELDNRSYEPNFTKSFGRSGSKSSVPDKVNGRRSKPTAND